MSDNVFPGMSDYGWDEALEASFTPHREAGLVPARVARVDRGRCDLITGTGPTRATIPTDLTPFPCTGDWVALHPGEAVLAEVLPRRTALVRSSASRRSDGQVLAANVDTVVVVVSLAARLALGRVERMLALAWESGARPVVVLTKADLADDTERALAEVAAAAPGADVLAVSATTGDGLDALRAVLTGTIVLIGPSGAGKSTLGNALLGTERLAVGEVRAADGKGRHTTVHRELLALPHGGVLIDTPGLRAVGLWDADSGVRQAFAEIEELAERCRFADCAHGGEPGCAVLAAVESGELSQRRFDSYLALQRENEWIASRTDARLRLARKNERKAITRFQRKLYRERGRG
ncbi:ribosome small subunit-dependent GTPase A [Saccharothrix coeruleofusca]|uniref:Small ribosomal subunit biogenesis GTPase RsgA n=1 Tax=Saccharothrix coeruleofusca TaxID=33919 RepID=A0A918AUM7_9PSEU|nr:ribosome small subunit-dependent GTPase A [Saccharothrix coeruleofusca]MBP2338902.1 ribosome biogenesis GTPase [Saccharothrix coeruleofusca]GGP86199.1 putative ribosome biogenesis GTPase RsgA [Saccharothrix coeruleofusca]